MDRRLRPLRRTVVALLGAAVVLSTALLPGVVNAAAKTWVVSVSFPPPIANIESLSCFSSTGCVAVGWSTAYNGLNTAPMELRTVDGGAQWTPVVVPRDVIGLYALACVGTVCLTGGQGNTALRSTDDGLSWHDVSLPPSITSVNAIACPTASSCFIEGQGAGFGVSGTIVASPDGGATWSTQYTESTTSLRQLWCASATRCFAYGASFIDTTDGSTWGNFVPPANFPTQAWCSSATSCVGASPWSGLVVTSDGGGSWAITDGSFVPTSIACGNALDCVSSDGTDLATTHDGGATWSEQTPTFDSQNLIGIACLTATNCQVVGSASADGYDDRALMLAVSPTAASYSVERVTNAIDFANSVSCASPTACDATAVDAYGSPVLLRTSNGGGQWTSGALPAALATIDDVLCTTPSTCLLTGSNSNGRGAVWRTTNAGAAWLPSGVPAAVGEVDDVSCLTATRCAAVGYLTNSWTTVLSSGNGGRSWTSAPMPHVASDLFGVRCPSTRDCVVVGDRAGGAVGVAYYSTTSGRTWHTSKLTGGLQALEHVACVSALVCLAASDVLRSGVPHAAVARTTNGGATWVAVSAPGVTSTLSSLVCWSPTSCEAVGQTTAALDADNASAAAAIATANGGKSWTSQGVPLDQWGLSSVSCAKGGACMAVGVGSYDPPNFPTGGTILRLP